jgi:hypothetical protein
MQIEPMILEKWAECGRDRSQVVLSGASFNLLQRFAYGRGLVIF